MSILLSATVRGGGICVINDLYVNYAKTSNSQFNANSATFGGAIFFDHGAEVGGSFVINTTLFSDNYASEVGGGLYLDRGDRSEHTANFIYHSTFQTNVAESSGGAIYITDKGFLNVTDTQFINNITPSDIENGGYVLACANSTVNIGFNCEFDSGNYSQLFENQANSCTGNLWTHCSCSCSLCVRKNIIFHINFISHINSTFYEL